MFRKLKNHFVLANMAISTTILIIAFSSIYFVALSSANHRPPIKINLEYGENVTELFESHLNEERQASLGSLLFSLIVTGAAVEIVVFLISIHFADQAIKPVKDAYSAQKAFIANASHEIKTPLAVISANLEAADIKGNHWLDNVSEKVEDLTNLNNQLLALARAEGSLDHSKKLETVDLKHLVKSIANPYSPQISQKGIELKIDTSKAPKKNPRLNRPDLKQILNILLDNAIKYSDHSIIIILTENQISIQNDGTIIKKSDLPHLFDRFYQVDKTKSGVGLGLAIAHQLAELNNWTLTASSGSSTTTFTINFSTQKRQLALS